MTITYHKKAMDDKVRLDNFVTKSYPIFTRSHIKGLIKDRKILVNKNIVKAGYILREGDKVDIEEIEEKELRPQNLPLDIIYNDEDLAVINKPQGMIVHPTDKVRSGTLVNALMFYFDKLSDVGGKDRLGIVHRLDKDTSGLIVIAKNNKTHKALQEQIRCRTFKRVYLGICQGVFKHDTGEVKNYLVHTKKKYTKFCVSLDKNKMEGKFAHTYFEVLSSSNNFSLVKFILSTGRTHQIRVHASFLGHPIVGDRLYGKGVSYLKGQLLHCYMISFFHPSQHRLLTFTAAPPKYFMDFMTKEGLKLEKN